MRRIRLIFVFVVEVVRQSLRAASGRLGIRRVPVSLARRTLAVQVGQVAADVDVILSLIKGEGVIG